TEKAGWTFGLLAKGGVLTLALRGGLAYVLTKEERGRMTSDDIIARGKNGSVQGRARRATTSVPLLNTPINHLAENRSFAYSCINCRGQGPASAGCTGSPSCADPSTQVIE
ncbi:MAG: hypothetical protein AB7P19_21020, partial [Nitrospira sp.]